jgi:hypothetical protein
MAFVLPHWPSGTVAILCTVGEEPHAIPVSAVHRADERRLLLGLAETRGSLRRLRQRPQVAVALIAADLAVTAIGHARVLGEPLVKGVVAVLVEVDTVRDHLQPTFEIQAGVQWRWTDRKAAERDQGVRTALARLARDL